MPIDIKDFTVLEMSEMLKEGKPFSFTRYGDGEWKAILGYSGKNCDGHEYSAELMQGLRKAVANKSGIKFGMQSMAMRLFSVQIENYLDIMKINHQWYHSDLLHRANLAGRLFPFMQGLNVNRVCFVGPGHLKKAGIRHAEYVEVLSKNCYTKVDGVFKRICTHLKKCNVVLFSASMMSDVLIDRLYPICGDKVTMINCGSMWDGYVGMRSRSFVRDPKNDWNKLRAMNFEGVKPDDLAKGTGNREGS